MGRFQIERKWGKFGLKYRLVVEGVTSWGRFKIERKGEVVIEVQAGSRRGYNLGAVQDWKKGGGLDYLSKGW